MLTSPSSTTTASRGSVSVKRSIRYCGSIGFVSAAIMRVDARLVALRAPVVRLHLGEPLRRRRAVDPQQRQQCAQRLLHIGMHGEVGAVVLAELVRALGDVDHAQPGRQRLDRAVDRHAQQIGAEHQQQVMRLECLCAPASAGALALPMNAGCSLGKCAAYGMEERVDRCAEELGAAAPPRRTHRASRAPGRRGSLGACAFASSSAIRASVASVGRTAASTRTGRPCRAQPLIEHVARQAEEHRTGRRRERDLRGAMDDARQVGGARDFDRPLHERLRHRHQGLVQHRLEQAVSLLLLARR